MLGGSRGNNPRDFAGSSRAASRASLNRKDSRSRAWAATFSTLHIKSAYLGWTKLADWCWAKRRPHFEVTPVPVSCARRVLLEFR